MKKIYKKSAKGLSFLVGLLFLLTPFIIHGQETEVDPSPDPCTIDVQCGFQAINNYVIEMGNMPYSGPYPDPPQSGCGLDNPNWFAFVAGGTAVTLTINVAHCSQGSSGPGVQLTIYEGDPECNISPGSAIITGLTYIAGRCSPAMSPGVYTYTFNTVPGYTYYMLLDGWGSSLCTVEVSIEQGGEPPALEETIEPEEVYLPEFDGPDTICLGANEIMICADDLPFGAAYTLWAMPNGDTVRSEIGAPCVLLENAFNEVGEVELCVAAASDCDVSPFECRTYTIAPLETIEIDAEICEGEDYFWEFDDINASGLDPGEHHFDMMVEASAEGCMQEHKLNLIVKPTNRSNPTVIDTILCDDEDFYFDVNPSTPEDYFTLYPVDEDSYVDKSLLSGCDTFFTITVDKVGGRIEINDPQCDENGNLMFTFEFIPFGSNLSLNDPRLTVEYSWYGGDYLISTDEVAYLSEDILHEYLESGTVNVELYIRVIFGDKMCEFAAPPYEVDISRWIPDFDVSGPTTICPGSSGEYTVEIDFDPFWSGDFIVQTQVSYLPSGITFEEIVTNEKYRLKASENARQGEVCFELTTRCGFTNEYCFLLEISDVEQPEVGDDREECDPVFSIIADPGAYGEWITGSIPDGAEIDFNDASSPSTEVEVNKHGKYTFIWVEGEEGCQKMDSLVIEYVEGPKLDGSVSYDCSPDQTTYTVSFEVKEGEPPYSVESNNGTMDGNVFTSEPFDTESENTIVIQDTVGCVLIVEVTRSCNCENEPAEMFDEEILLCADGSTDVDIQTPGTPRPEDGGEFVLHDGSGNVLGQVYDRNNTGVFTFPDDAEYGVTYYISYVIGAESGGDVDLADPCLQVAPGQPVVWYAYPVADAGRDTTVCGFQYALDASPSRGSWEFIDGPGEATFTDEQARDSDVSVDEIGTYVFRWIADNHGCLNENDVEITFVGDLSFSNTVVECSPDKSEYRIITEVSGGAGNYVVDSNNGVDGTFAGNIVTTEWLNIDDVGTLIVSDELGCGPIEMELEGQCDCESEVGSMIVGNVLTACEEGGCVSVDYDADGEYLDGNDSYMYVLHTEDNVDDLGDVLMQNQTGEFCFDENILEAGVVYYVSYVVGNEDVDGVDLDDQCLAVTEAQEILFYELPIAKVMNDTLTCDVEINLVAYPSIQDSEGEWTIVSQPSGSGTVIIDREDQAETTATIDGTPGDYCFRWVETNGDCSDDAEVCIELLDSPVVDGNSITHECNTDGETFTVKFIIQGGDSDSYTVNGNAGQLQGNEFTSDPIHKDSTYTFYISDSNACDTIVLTDTHECPCLTEAGQISVDDQHLCEDETLVVTYDGNISQADNDVYEFLLLDADGQVIQRNQTGEFTFDENTMTREEVYDVIVHLGNPAAGGTQVDMDDDCLDKSNTIQVQWYAYPEVHIEKSDDIITCTVQEITLDASMSSPQGEVEFTWEASQGGSIKAGNDNSPRPVITSGGVYSVTVTHSVSGCESVGEIIIEQSDDVPEIRVEEYGKLTCAINNITLDARNSTQSTTIETIWRGPDGQEIETEDEYILVVSSPGVYTFTLYDSSTDCEITKEIEVKEDVEKPIAVASVDAMLGCSSEEVTVSGQGSAEGAQYTYQWTTDEGVIVGSTTSLQTKVSEAGIYTLTVRDSENGCESSVEVLVEKNPVELSKVDIRTSGLQCEGEDLGTIQARALNGTEPYIYTLNGDQSNSTGLFTDLNPGVYTLEVEDAFGCVVIETIELIAPEAFTAEFIDNIRIKEGDSAVIYFASISSTIADIQWEVDGDFRCISNGEVCDSIMISDIESQVIVATLVNENGCVIERYIQVLVVKDRAVFIPNAFSPNNDGVNDMFTIGAGPKVAGVTEMEIYDRWGNRVYYLEDMPVEDELKTWDGTYRGEYLLPGVYMYRVNVLYDDGEEIQFTGDVTLMK